MTPSLLGSELGKKWDGASMMERTAGPEVSGQGRAGADGEQEGQCSWSRERIAPMGWREGRGQLMWAGP